MKIYRIKHENGTYYAGRCGIGPMFGATKEGAKQFTSLLDAVHERQQHSFAFVLTKIEDEEGKP